MQEDKNPNDTMPYQAKMLQLLIENARDFAIVMMDTQECIVLWNTGAENMLGWQGTDIIGQPAALFFTPEDRAAGAPEKEFRTAREQGRAEDERWHIRKDGSRFWGSGLVQPVYDSGELHGYLKIFRDLTAHRQSEDALRQSEARYRAAQDTSLDGFMMLEAVRSDEGAIIDFRWTYVNEAAAHIVGHPREWFAGRLLLEEMPGNREEGLFDAYVRVVETGQPHAQEARYDHEGVQVYIRLMAVKAEDGFGVTFADLTERQMVQDALRKSEARFRALADNIAQLAWMADGTGWIFWYNRRWFNYTGTTLEEMQGWGWKSVHHPDYIKPVTERWAEHLSAGWEWEDTFPLRSKDGNWRWFLSRAFPIRDEAGNVTLWFGTNTDITEQRESEEALRRHQAEIEGLNARLARAMQEAHHRIKNNLQVIAALVEMQADELGDGSAVQRIKQHVRALAAIHDLLTQQAKADTNTSVVSAREVLQRLIPMLQATSGDRRIKADVDEVMLPVQKATSLSLLVSECVSNAIKHAKGEVEITLRREDSAVRLEVCDDGDGFPAGFDPRKAANTGLELIDSTARWDLRGELRYENQAKGGGRIVVTFPLDTFVE